MAISGVGKMTDQGLLARTLSHMSTVNKTAAPQPVKEPTQVKRVNEGGAGDVAKAPQTKQSAIARQAPPTMAQVTTKPKATSTPQLDKMESAAVLSAGLDIKA